MRKCFGQLLECILESGVSLKIMGSGKWRSPFCGLNRHIQEKGKQAVEDLIF